MKEAKEHLRRRKRSFRNKLKATISYHKKKLYSELEAISTTQKSKLQTELNDVCEEANLNVKELQQSFQKELEAISSHF